MTIFTFKKITINGVYYSIEEKEMKFKLYNENYILCCKMK